MKGNLLIVFNSSHGYTMRYVEIIGNAVGCDAVPVDKLRPYMFPGYDRILYMGGVRGRTVDGFSKLNDYLGAIYKKLIVCGVGMFPFRPELPDKIKDATISVTYEKFIPVFYAQGGFDFSELGRREKMAVALTVRQLKLAQERSEDDEFYLNAVATPFDEVKKANVTPLIDYLEGRNVDDTLYSPPEITDEEEEKQFFKEIEDAAKTPESKKRELKKKLKGGFKKSTAPEEKEPEKPAEKDEPEEPGEQEPEASQEDGAPE